MYKNASLLERRFGPKRILALARPSELMLPAIFYDLIYIYMIKLSCLFYKPKIKVG
jgi:hypothetical protein